MRVLVTAASKHGSTTEIARTIGWTLEDAGIRTRILEPDEVRDVGWFDAAVIGSAVYAGRWLESARDFVERTAPGLAGKPVWLFSSGPLGNPPEPATEPADVPAVMAATGAREHRTFAGVLYRSRLGFVERAVSTTAGAAEGDFRAWNEIKAWAVQIATTLLATEASRT
jgi:menaquinone-dependent protoporphyrinogen oxidase